MKIIPAVDIKEGKCVRLYQGRSDQATIYSDSPLDMAKKWESEGAEILHLVDLDGAFEGGMKNYEIIARIAEELKIPVEVGGGIRDHGAIERYMDIGVRYVILGTVAQSDPAFLREACRKNPGKVIVGIDAKEGKVAVRGWEKVTEETAVDMVKRLEGEGVASVIYTDIGRDGTLTGPNLESTKELAQAVGIPIIASGGVSGLEDIEALKALGPYGVSGVVVGKALYSGKFTLGQALEAAGKGEGA